MIVQPRDDGSVILINQSDHAKLSGLFAAHWGNGDFAAPQPYESVVRAAMFHDAGWYAYETAPRLMPNGTPMGFTQVPLDDATLAAYQWATDWMVGIDPYAGALVRKHRNGLWLGRYDSIAHPPMFGGRGASDALKAFITRNEIVREREERALGAEFAVNYQLLQVFDLLSLMLCMRPPREEYIVPVPTGYAGDAAGIGVRLDLTPIGGGRLVLAPWPFDVPRLPVGIVHRHLPRATFASEEEFRRAYFAAPLQTLAYEFVSGA